MARYAVVLDACVLVPIALADTLLRIAERGLYRPLWSTRIVAEATDAIAGIHPEIAPEQVGKALRRDGRRLRGRLYRGMGGAGGCGGAPDPDDRHVVAAAIGGRADAIATANVAHYRADVLEPSGIEVIHPDDFLLDQLDLAPRVVLEALHEQAAHTRRPPLTPVDLIARLARAGVPRFADEASRRI